MNSVDLLNIQNLLKSTIQGCDKHICQQQEQMNAITQSQNNLKEKLEKSQEKLNQLIKRLETQYTINQIQLIKQSRYQFELQMEDKLELPFYRNRIFSIRLKLVQNNKLIQNINNILVELQIWTYDKVPKNLTHNNHNQTIYKGCQQSMIKRGKGILSKIQIREVSSHFPRGLFMFVIVPVEDTGVFGDLNKKEIKKEWIKPLVIQEVSVKAKRFSDKHIPYFANSDGTIQLITKQAY